MSEITQQQDSRRIFVDTLNELAETDDKIIVLIPDVGFNYLDNPELNFKVINTGVTEQSTILIAAAMALDGWKPYVYSMINFVLFRPYEMVRNGIVHHHANVKLIGVKGSSKYKFLGFSHNMNSEYEDIRACENLGLTASVVEDPAYVAEHIKAIHKLDTPHYTRI